MCAKFFYILIVLMAGLFPFKMQASETKQTFILYTPYTKISVPPGEERGCGTADSQGILRIGGLKHDSASGY